MCDETSQPIAGDLLVGADAIAAFLGLTRRQIYTMRESGHPAIVHETGLGLVARKSVLSRIGLPKSDQE